MDRKLRELTPSQLCLLKLLGEGASVKEIAWQTGKSYKSVDSRKYRLMKKLELNDRFQVAILAIKNDLVRTKSKSEHSPDILSERQKEILQHVASGMRTVEIARATGLSIKSVDAHKQRGMYVLGLTDRVQILHYCVSKGLVDV
jgi:DNA-binding NarL/FixJ family response regulator